MLEIVETTPIPIQNKQKFIEWFNEEIGTEWEENEVDDNYTTFTIFTLTLKEFKKTQSFLETCGEITWDEHGNLNKDNL